MLISNEEVMFWQGLILRFAILLFIISMVLIYIDRRTK